MTGTLLRLAGWLTLAYLAVKLILAYYLVLLAPNRITSALATPLALSPWDCLILLVGTGSLAWSLRACELSTWASTTFRALVIRETQALPPHAIDSLRAELRTFALRCRTETAGHEMVDFSGLHNDGNQLLMRLLATELEPQMAPLLTNLQQCAEISEQITRLDMTARALREQGLEHRAHREDNSALEQRMRLLGYREQVKRAADRIVRSTAPLLL
jgi:hypothetical protein